MSNCIKSKKNTRKKCRKHNKDKSRKHKHKKHKKHKTKKQKGGLINTAKILMNWVRGKKSDETDKSDKSEKKDKKKDTFNDSLKKGFWAGLGSDANDSDKVKAENFASEVLLHNR